MIAVSKSLFVEEERVQLLVKDLVEALRDGPQGKVDSEERLSERMERTFEYQQLVKNYPEIIQAAARDDGLDIATLWSAAWSTRPTLGTCVVPRSCCDPSAR
jgi:hypothetical protein